LRRAYSVGPAQAREVTRQISAETPASDVHRGARAIHAVCACAMSSGPIRLSSTARSSTACSQSLRSGDATSSSLNVTLASTARIVDSSVIVLRALPARPFWEHCVRKPCRAATWKATSWRNRRSTAAYQFSCDTQCVSRTGYSN